jgi:hypothetical protein
MLHDVLCVPIFYASDVRLRTYFLKTAHLFSPVFFVAAAAYFLSMNSDLSRDDISNL